MKTCILSPLFTCILIFLYSFSHPYEFELERFTPSHAQLERTKPQKFKPLEETPLVMVDHADQLPDLLQDLANYSEIAVDLEVSGLQEQ
jgi:exosome complex exonuclease RRP6